MSSITINNRYSLCQLIVDKYADIFYSKLSNIHDGRHVNRIYVSNHFGVTNEVIVVDSELSTIKKFLDVTQTFHGLVP